jgi:hypothetical protein
VEVKKHRLAISREEDIGRFDVHVDQPSVVGVLQRIGQAGNNPADRPDVRSLGDEPQSRTLSGLGSRAWLLGSGEDVNVDQSDRRFGLAAQPRMTIEEDLGGWTLSPLPSGGELLDKLHHRISLRAARELVFSGKGRSLAARGPGVRSA